MNDWALILGASSGIGHACVKALAENGINIYGIYFRHKSDYMDNFKKELLEHNVKVIFKKANASNDESRIEIINELANQESIRIKMFIHSIAFGTLKPMIDKNENHLIKKNIEMTSDVMCNNLIYWSQDIFAKGLFHKGSQILAMTSAGGRKNWESYGAVSLAKAGIESVCRQLSIELAQYGIAVNSIQAGVTDTPALRKIPGYEKMIEKTQCSNPHKRITTPQDIADFISLLSKYESSWMTGNNIRVDGGEEISN